MGLSERFLPIYLVLGMRCTKDVVAKRHTPEARPSIQASRPSVSGTCVGQPDCAPTCLRDLCARRGSDQRHVLDCHHRRRLDCMWLVVSRMEFTCPGRKTIPPHPARSVGTVRNLDRRPTTGACEGTSSESGLRYVSLVPAAPLASSGISDLEAASFGRFLRLEQMEA